MVEEKDVISVIVPSALGLSGLLLVFVGFLLQLIPPLREHRQPTKVRRFIVAATGWQICCVVLTAAVGIVTSALGTAWLVNGGGAQLYQAAFLAFFVTLALALLIVILLPLWLFVVSKR